MAMVFNNIMSAKEAKKYILASFGIEISKGLLHYIMKTHGVRLADHFYFSEHWGITADAIDTYYTNKKIEKI
jgi:hypothetical protein